MALRLGLAILPEERAVPMILHQKLSALLAREVFDIKDQAVISAIACHTTLKAHASTLDKVVFLADKIAWDQKGSPPYLEGCLTALESAQNGALNSAVLQYLNYLWERRADLPTIHPWFASARRQLLQQ